MCPRANDKGRAAKLVLYDKLVATNPKVERKGDTNPYTSHNGHMFTHFAPPGVLAIRLSPDDLASFIKKYKTAVYKAYGVVKKTGRWCRIASWKKRARSSVTLTRVSNTSKR
jgi:hypothetical protein